MTKDDQMHAEAYASGVLSPEVHGRLVADLDSFARDAGITRSHIWTSLLQVLSDDEIAYLKALRRQSGRGLNGLVLTGKQRDAQGAMSAMAGFMVRNFIRARVVTLSKFAEEGPFSDITALLVPNFFVSKHSGGDFASWKVSMLLDHLHARRLAGLQTFLYVSDRKAMAVEYGTAVEQFLAQSFQFTA